MSIWLSDLQFNHKLKLEIISQINLIVKFNNDATSILKTVKNLL